MSGIQFTQAPLLDPTAKTALSIGGQIDAISADRSQSGRYVSEALRSLKNWAHFIEAQLSEATDNQFPEILVLGEGGQLIGWIGARDGYSGGYFSQLYVGGTDPSNAPFFTDVNGNLTIGQNGSVTIRDAAGTRVGFLGVETEATKAVISISNATPPVVNVTAHGYVTGDSVTIAGNSVTAYNANWPIIVIDANNFSLTGGVASGAGAGGTAARYYAGAWLKTAAAGGTGFADAKFRVFGDGSLFVGTSPNGLGVDAAGNVTINGAELTLNLNGVTTSISNTAVTLPTLFGGSTSYAGIDVSNNTSGASAILLDSTLLMYRGTPSSSTLCVAIGADTGGPSVGGKIYLYDGAGNMAASILGTGNITATGSISATSGFIANGSPGMTGSFSYIKSVNFIAQTTTSGSATVVGGLVVSAT